ncbi:Protein disulfide-isomerase, partial [Caligus rogercresseyi]
PSSWARLTPRRRATRREVWRSRIPHTQVFPVTESHRVQRRTHGRYHHLRLEKKTGPPAATLKTDLKVAVVGLFESALSMDDETFFISSEEALFKEHDISGDSAIILLKKFDGGRNDLTEDFTVDPSVPSFLQRPSPHQEPHPLLHVCKSAEFDPTVKMLGNVAKEHKGKMLFVTIDTDEEDHKRILEFFGVKEEELPTMRLIKLEEDMSKFRPDVEELTESNIKSFIKSFFDGTSSSTFSPKRSLRTGDKEEVKVLVGKNFEEVALNKDKNVLQLVPIWDELGNKFADKEDIVLAKMDSTANELEDIKITDSPPSSYSRRETTKLSTITESEPSRDSPSAEANLLAVITMSFKLLHLIFVRGRWKTFKISHHHCKNARNPRIIKIIPPFPHSHDDDKIL